MSPANLWHDLEPGTAESLNVIVEIPKGSENKYEVSRETGQIALDRVLDPGQSFPFDYGFVPRTLWDDGDPLDVVLLPEGPLSPGTLVRARPVAFIDMSDSGDGDAKIVAVPEGDSRWGNARDKADVSPEIFQEIDHFFTTYKQLQHGEVIVRGIGGAAEAHAAFGRAVRLYREKFGKS